MPSPGRPAPPPTTPRRPAWSGRVSFAWISPLFDVSERRALVFPVRHIIAIRDAAQKIACSHLRGLEDGAEGTSPPPRGGANTVRNGRRRAAGEEVEPTSPRSGVRACTT